MAIRYPANILSQIKSAIISWQAIDPSMTFGDLSLANLQDTLTRGEQLKQQIAALETRLTDLRNQRDEVYHTGWKYISRLRDGVKGLYGDDSSEYEMVGRMRRSEYKPRSKRVRVKMPKATSEAG